MKSEYKTNNHGKKRLTPRVSTSRKYFYNKRPLLKKPKDKTATNSEVTEADKFQIERVKGWKPLMKISEYGLTIFSVACKLTN